MLARGGIAAREADSWERTQADLSSGQCQLVIADSEFAGLACKSFLERLRNAGTIGPVIILVHRSYLRSWLDFRYIADAILRIPFSFFELMNRVEMVLCPDSRRPTDLTDGKFSAHNP